MLERLVAVLSILSFSLINIKFLSFWSTGQCLAWAWLSRPDYVLLWRPLSSPYIPPHISTQINSQVFPIRPYPSTQVPKSHLLLALLQPSLLHQADELATVFIMNSHITATRDEVHHLAVAQRSGEYQFFAEPELKRFPVHCLHGLQQVYLRMRPVWCKNGGKCLKQHDTY